MSVFNGVMMQFFHWYTPADGTLWRRLAEEAPALAAAGITGVWLPPAYKGAAGPSDVGYSVYDIFDLGEFEQKGSVRTKYGTRSEYVNAIRAAQDAGVQVYADIVFNHKLGADHQEEFTATPHDPEDRRKRIGPPQTIRAWTHFTFPGREGRYSQLRWHWWHFNGADHNALDDRRAAVYLFDGKSFDRDVDPEKGNYDYLMGCNLDINNPDVRQELFYWGEWLMDTTGVDGFRFDAVKHVKPAFFLDWLHHVRSHAGRELFAVGEYWHGDTRFLRRFLHATRGNLMLFDVKLHYNFAAAGRARDTFDLRTIFEGTLVASHPMHAVTLVSNHDSQPLQALESVVAGWFKPPAYALILLRRDGYPCIFAADYYGAHYRDIGSDGREHEVWMDSHRWLIDKFLMARRTWAYGLQRDYFDDPACVGWTRQGDPIHPGGMAVVLARGGGGVGGDSDGGSSGDEGTTRATAGKVDDGIDDRQSTATFDSRSRTMKTGVPHGTYTDLTEHIPHTVTTDVNGRATFSCRPGSVSVWVPQ